MRNRLAALVFVSLTTMACAGGSSAPAGTGGASSGGGATGASGGAIGSGGGSGGLSGASGGTPGTGGRGSGGVTGAAGSASGGISGGGGAGGAIAWHCVEIEEFCFCNMSSDSTDPAKCLMKWPCCFTASATSCQCADQATCDFAKAQYPDARIVSTCPAP